MATAPRRLLARLRELMAHDAAPLPELVRLVSGELVSEVCSVYALRPGDILELVATEGLRAEAVGHTRLRVGEGIVGLVAATGQALNLPDAQNHPAFAYRPETGEARFASMLAVPVRRAGRTLGVLAVQNRTPRRYDADEAEVLETVAMLLAEALVASGATDGASEGLAATVPRRFEGVSLVPGIAVGPVIRLGLRQPPARLLADDPDWETGRLARALAQVRTGLDDLMSGVVLPEGDGPREIMEAYRLVAADQGWVRRVGEAIRGGLTAEAAVHRVAGEMHDRMRRVTDPYLRERLADMEDVAGRLLTALDEGATPPEIATGAILVARRLGPAELLDWHGRGVAGFAVEEGSAAGHAAILARALGIPALGGVRGILDTAEDGDEAVLDADDGQLVLRPEQAVLDAYSRALRQRDARRVGWAELRGRPAATRDGVGLKLMLNVGLTLELDQLEATGADGIGLFRTEIVMLARGAVVDVAEQATVYNRVLDAAGDRPVLFRTLDLGGDKMLPGTQLESEENPAMGWRSLRVGLDRPALMKRQLKALLMAAAGRPLSVMFPMVSTVAEFRAARALLEAELGRVERKPERLQVGTMIEVPALLFQMPTLLQVADFVSLGTNDLMQFLFAADRGTASLAHRYDALSPPFLDVLEQVANQAAAAGVPLSVCGEIAARPLEAMALAALGLTTLSMPATALPEQKAFLAGLDLAAFRPVLASIRRNAEGEASLREPIASWAHEHGLHE